MPDETQFAGPPHERRNRKGELIKKFGPYETSEKGATLSLSVCKMDVQSEGGTFATHYAVSLEKFHQTPTGAWERTATIKSSEIPLAILLYEQAKAFIDEKKSGG